MMRLMLRLGLCILGYLVVSCSAAFAGGRIPLWSTGKIPDFQPQQVATVTEVQEAPGYCADDHRMPYLDWTEPASNRTGACVILVSGGAYKRLCDGWLVEEWRKRFLSMGITCVELVHRTPRPEGLPIYQSAWEDGQRAVRIVRREAAKRGLVRIGACGMSAGAHLVTLLATSSQTPAYAKVDDLDDTPCNLDFALCFAIAYGMTDATAGTVNARDGDGPDLKLDPAFKFDAKTCPMWMGHGGADPNSPLVSTHVYRQLRRMKVPAEVHLYPDKPHGAYGLDRAVEFLTQMEFLGKLRTPVDLLTRYGSNDARASYEKKPVWPEGAMPDVRTNQCTPYLEWHVPKVLRTKAIQIIYSGGSYMGNSPDGHEVAPARRFLNEKGMTVVTMKYRTPRPAGLPKHVTAWQDLQRCIRLVRSEALPRGLDPDRIGIMGSSAGGHLTLMGATSSQRHAYLPNDTIDKAYKCNANWAVAIYPAYALTDGAEVNNTTGGNDDSARLVPEFSFDLATCPTLFIHGDADHWASMNSVKCWEQMRRMGIQGELHTLALRSHCFQFKAAPGTGSYTWLNRIWEFLEAKKFLDDYDASDEAAAKRREWEDPAVNSINRLPSRTYAMPLASEADALTDDLEPATPYKKSLNGKWKISWAGNPQLRVKDFWKTDFDDSRWFSIDVPSCVEMKGFGSPAYSAGAYPHAAEFPRILDFDTKKPDYNPVSSYRTTFTVPESWKGRRVILRFDGVYSAYYVWVNGKKVGYAEDSKLPSEFDITEYIQSSNNSNIQTFKHSNILCVEVYRWSDGSYLEDQDMFRFSGIFRDVTLWSMPKDGVWDFRVKASADGRLEVAVLDEVEKVGGGGQRTQVSIYDAGHTKVGNLTPLSTSTYSLHLASPRLWSAEDPYLYTLVIRRGEDIRMKRIGFKEQKVVGNAILVNGKPIKFKGVNRHETSVDNARTVSLAEMLRDAELMKKYNIDTVRTSHYPDHHLWYDICDRYGLYVMAEANVEGHAYGFGADGVGSKPAFYDTIVERNVRQVEFYRNHPSVTFWSMGNETGHGDGFRQAIVAVKKLDPSRPINWQMGNADADLDSSMYPSVDWLEKRGELGNAQSGTLAGAGSGAFVQASQHTAGKPYFCIEYAHAMGNAIGNFQEYWDVFNRYPSLTGGCIWDWIDQSFWWPTDRLDPKTGKRGRFLAYGSDFDEVPGDGPFCNNGVIGPNRAVSAKLIEVGHVHRNLVVEKVKGEGLGQQRGELIFELWNRYGFTRADAFEGRAELVVDGVVVETQSFAVPPVEPLSKGRLELPKFKRAAKPGEELFVNISFHTKADTPWAKRGWCVARNQVTQPCCCTLAVAAAEKTASVRQQVLQGSQGSQGLQVSETDKTVAIAAGPTKAVFCRASGTLCELAMNGRTILKDADIGLVAGPQLTVERAYTDNDRWMRHGNAWVEDRVKGSVYSRGLTQLRYHARPLVAASTGGVVTVESEVEVTGSKSAGFTHVSRWTFRADGSVVVANTVDPHGTMPPALPRLGFTFKLDRALDAVAYYGRGPYENYVDRCTGSFLGLWRTTVDGLWEPYVRPQDNGYRGDVRWVELTAADGKGVRFAGETPMFFQAMRYSPKDLEFARHRGDERRYRNDLVPRDEIWVNVDFRQTGLGGGSCGPLTLPKCVFPIQKESWSYSIAPVGR